MLTPGVFVTDMLVGLFVCSSMLYSVLLKLRLYEMEVGFWVIVVHSFNIY